MAGQQRTSCNCSSCGAETEHLLEIKGTLGTQFDKVVVGIDPKTGRRLLFKDIRKTPFRLPWAPRLTLVAGLAPIGIALLVLLSSSVVGSMSSLVDARGTTPLIITSINGVLPGLLSAFFAMSLLVAALQYWQNARYVERQAWLEGIANSVDRLRSRAGSYMACSYCRSLHGRDGRAEATPASLQAALGVDESPAEKQASDAEPALKVDVPDR